MDGLDFSTIMEKDASWLERPFGEDEIKDVVFNMSDDKAPRPEGYSFTFYKACLEVVRQNIIDVLTYFLE